MRGTTEARARKRRLYLAPTDEDFSPPARQDGVIVGFRGDAPRARRRPADEIEPACRAAVAEGGAGVRHLRIRVHA